MFMISLVLGTGKRLSELNLLNEQALNHRTSLNESSTIVLNEMLLISSSASLIAYALYTVEQSKGLIYSVPLVTLGLFRYIALAKQGVGDPTTSMTEDKWLALTIIAWLVLIGVIRYL